MRQGFGRLSAVLCSLLAFGGLVGCGSDDGDTSGGGSDSAAASEKQVRIAYLANGINSWVQANIEGVKEGARGAKVTVFNANADPGKQISQTADAVTSGRFDALVVSPFGPPNVPGLKAAIERGLKVATTLGPLEDPAGTSALPGQVIATNQRFTQRGTAMGETIVEACGSEPCEVALVLGFKSLPADAVVNKGVGDVLQSHSTIKVVATAEGNYDPETSRKAVQNVLQAHPGVDVIATAADLMTQGAYLAETATQRDHIKLIGVGASDSACKAVADGKWYATLTTLPKTEGILVGEALAAAVRTGKMPADRTPDPIAKSTFGVVVTEENAADCKPQWTQ